MARYIDADKFKEGLEKDKAEALDFGDCVAAYAIDNIINLVVSQPTADVVSKGVIAKIFEDIDKCRIISSHGSCGFLIYDIHAIKKKYTEKK